jgi:hypothetical protein
LEAALAYAASGFAIFPTHDVLGGACSCGQVCPSPGKHPRTRNGFKDSTTDTGTIASWWRTWPSANVAIDCGKSGIVVVDVDVKKSANGKTSLEWLRQNDPAAFDSTLLIATPSGGYHYVFRGAIKSGQGTLGEGVDVRSIDGYVLAPPSIAFGAYDENRLPVSGSQRPYEVIRPAPIVPFPQHLAPRARPDTIEFGSREFAGPERDGIPYGEHRQSLLWFGWHLRSVQGLSVEAGLPIMRAYLAALDDYNPANPFSDRDLRGMLANVKPNIAAAPPPGPVTLFDAIESAHTVIANAPQPRQAIISGLMIQGELHVIYGTDGVGKTTIAAYEVALVTRQGRDVLAFVSEDQPRDFAIKVWHSGGDISRLHLYNAGRSLREFLLPKCKVDLEQMLAARPYGCVYFDSIGDMKSTDIRTNAADEARQMYGPLSSLAQQYNTAIVVTAHTNARDVLEGARQIRAKARVVARVERPKQEVEMTDDTISFGGSEHDPMWCAHVTTEKFSRGVPGMRHAFFFESRPSMDPYTGKADVEFDPNGVAQPKMLYVATWHEQMEPVSTGKLPSSAPVRTDIEAKIADMLRANPALSASQIYAQIGGRKTDVLSIVKKLKAT